MKKLYSNAFLSLYNIKRSIIGGYILVVYTTFVRLR